MKEATIDEDAIAEDDVPNNPVLVDGNELEELKNKADKLQSEKDTVENLKEDLAEQLSQEAVFLSKEDCMEWDIDNLQDKISEIEEQEQKNTDPVPRGDSGDVGSVEEHEEITELESRLEDYQDWGWKGNVEETKKEIEELKHE